MTLMAESELHTNGELYKSRCGDEQGLTLWDRPGCSLNSCRSVVPGQPLRVLLAEDNPLDQVSIRRILEKLEFVVTLAADGRRAVDLYESGTFDLVLLDILMPEMDGFEVATTIRRHVESSGDRIPIIALTAYSLNAVYDKCKSVGMNGYLSKPISGHDLRMLRSVLLPDPTDMIQG